jgi:hypothetical protein
MHLALLLAIFGQALSPSTNYESGIPSLKQVVGHDFGQEITTPDQIVTYLKALAAAAPQHTRLVEYARTWEGRPLFVIAIGSPERISRIDDIKADLRRLADPRGLAAGEAERLVKQLPVVTWLMHAVHGNEISSSDAGLAEAYHLLAARGDGYVDAILRESIVLIDPLQNPDGRTRFLIHSFLGRSAVPDPEPASAEHDEPWPGGRSNHYLFDMNRDWFALTQPETKGRTKLYLEWFPHVVVDLHEMGGDSTYYFAPPADPLNPHITRQQAQWFDIFGRENGRRFDERGFAYFIREVFDSFYPGYGESWPIFHGSIGMTYEQASTRGLVLRRNDDSLLSYREAVDHHFTAAITTAHTAAQNRERILRDFLEHRRSAVQEGGQGEVREYLVPPGPDPARTDRLVQLLVAQGIEVRRAEEPIRAASGTLPAGTWIVPLAQPAGRLARNLLQPHVPQPDAFVKEQERRRKKGLADQIYDVTAWSLPEVYDVQVVPSNRPAGVRSTPADPNRLANGSGSLAAARVAYLLPWGSGAAAAVVEALQQGIRVRSAGQPFTIGGRRYPSGTAVIRGAENGADLADRLGPIVAHHGAEAVPADSSYVEEGISLGSNQVVPLKTPRVLLAWDSPTQSTSAGWARYTLERRWGQRTTAIRTGSMGRADMNRFDVLVLPGGNYSGAFAGDALRRLKDWILAGGTLICLGEASRWAAAESVGLLETRTQLKDGRPEVEPAEKEAKKTEAPPKPFDFETAIQPERERPEAVPGALLRVILDAEHWLAAGTDGEIQAIVESQRVFLPIKLDKGRNVGVYAPLDRLVAGGLVWDEGKELLAQKSFLIHQPLGRGHIVAFAEDPNYRAFTEATQLLFINAVLFGPAY